MIREGQRDMLTAKAQTVIIEMFAKAVRTAGTF